MFLFGSIDLQAQKKKRRPAKEQETTERTTERTTDMATSNLRDKITYDILIGNLSFGSQFIFSPKLQAGYKFTDIISAGLTGKMNYVFQNFTGSPDVSFLDYGFGPYARFTFGESFYLQGEYDVTSFDLGNSRLTRSSPVIGGGYMSGFGDWKFGLQLMFLLDNDYRDTGIFGDLVEYYFGAAYNF